MLLHVKIKLFIYNQGLFYWKIKIKKNLIEFFSNEQNRLNNSDIFLLLLNNTSRSLRTQFQLQINNSSTTMAHIYKIKNDNIIIQNLTNSMTDLSVDAEVEQARRVKKKRTSIFFLIIFISIYIIVTIIASQSSRRINGREY